MQVGHDHRPVGDHGVQERLRHVAGLHGAETQPLQAGHLRHGVEQVGKVRAAGTRLLTPQGRLMAVGADEDPREHDLAMAQIDEPAGLGDRVLDGLGTQGAADAGDDAERAVGVTAVLDLQLRPDVGSRVPQGRHQG